MANQKQRTTKGIPGAGRIAETLSRQPISKVERVSFEPVKERTIPQKLRRSHKR